MTLEKLHNVALKLANSSWCRFWVDFQRVYDGQMIMAIQCLDEKGKPQRIQDAHIHSFAEHLDYLYIVLRTNEDGSPYISKL